jgi:N-acetylneuraminic acid mutarotase
MMTARAGHKATFLPNGKVLVAGGNNDDAACELYDPASGTWSFTGSLIARRWYGHSLTSLADGNALLTGGFVRGTILPSVAGNGELYDASSATWVDTGNGAGGGDHTATLLPNGKVLVAGGHFYSSHLGNVYLNSASLYDPATGNWSATGSMTNGRAYHTATLLPNGKVLVAGGHYANTPVANAELYDPATGTWSDAGTLTHQRSNHTAVLLHSGKVLIAGGDDGSGGPPTNSAELYDPSTGTWTPTGSLAGARINHEATLLASNRVLVTGGRDANGALATAELYDPTTGSWSSTGNLREPRYGHTATLLPDKRVLIAGGGQNNSRSAELYTEPPTPPRLLNISTRSRIQSGDNAMIGGFIITGTELKTIIIRGIGPSLGITGALADPVIEVHGPTGELLATNDNWRDAATSQQIIDSGLAPTNESESALWGTINPGSYTVVVRGKEDTTGIGSFEVYDLAETADSALANVSTRGAVGTGNDVMIGGIIVGGGTTGAAAKVMVRAIGPSLPIAGALSNPTLELRDASGALVAFNDDWKTRANGTSQQAEIEATTIPPSNDLESALVKTFAPGQYTAIVRGKGNTAGIGLVEVFNLR